MDQKNVEFTIAANTLSTLNLDQIASLRIAVKGIMIGYPADSYRKHGKELATQYNNSKDSPNGKNLTIPELLMALVYFAPEKLYGISVLLEEMRYNAIKSEQQKKLRTITELSPSVYSVHTFFPNYEDSPSPRKEKDILQEKINKLVFDAQRIEHEDSMRALELLDEAIELAKEKGMFYADIYEVRINLKKEDDIELVRLYETELKQMIDEGDDKRVFFYLRSLAHRFAHKGEKQKAFTYLDHAEEILKNMIYSDKPLTSHTDYEGYSRLMWRVHLSQLNMLRPRISTL